MNTPLVPDEDGELVFCRSFRHHKTGKTIYPKNGRFFVFRRKNNRFKADGPKQLELPLAQESR